MVSQRQFVHHKSQRTRVVLKLDLRDERPPANSLRNGTAKTNFKE